MKDISQQDIDTYVTWCQQHLPGFAICYKDESTLQKWIGALLWPINKRYMTAYTTVMFGKIYFPSRETVALWPKAQMYATLRHEFVHLMDAKRFPLWFEISYLLFFPAVLTMRAYWEYRGYVQNLLVEYERTNAISEETITWIVECFVRSEYGWMYPFRQHLTNILQRTKQRILKGELRGPYPYCEWGKETPT
ncbi:MAG TPA: hypothetical protein DCE42_03110 [Myxococcales bacterium]|nr:hypothetical protein [Myxococcales bacterium]